MATICVFCASSESVDPRHYDVAAALGEQIAQRGHVLVTGGGRVGSMGAIARAARAAGGLTIGVIPAGLLEQESADEHADELVVTIDMRERKGVMDERSDAFIALAGGIGTLEELLEAWTGRVLGMHDKPVIVLDPTGVFAPLRELVDRLCESGFVPAEAVSDLVWVGDPAEALDLIERSLR